MRTPVDSLKPCSTCREVKPIDEYYGRASAKDGKQSNCKKCANKARVDWGKRNPEKHKEWKRDRRVRSPRERRVRSLWRNHKLDLRDYEAMLADQGGVCAACGAPGDPLHVDHDHSCCPSKVSCGKCVRGLLCMSCNMALGLVQDEKERLMGLIDYLDRVN